MQDFSGDVVTLSLSSLLALRHLTLPPLALAARGTTSLPGKVQGRQRGNGLDFNDLRLYHPGDDVRHMDWNVTARTRKPHIRLYRQDRERAVSVALDLRPCMFNGSTQLRAALVCKLAALTLWQASRNGDRCAAIVLDATGIHASRPRIAERGVLEALRLISQHYERGLASPSGAESAPLTKLLEFINGAGRVAGSALLFSGLDHPGEHYTRDLAIASGHGRLTTVQVADPMESRGLPAGHYAYVSKQGNISAHLGRQDSRRLQQTLTRMDEEIREPFERYHLGFTRVDDFEQGRRPMLRYLNRSGLL